VRGRTARVTTEPAAARTPACLARRFARRWLALLVVLGGCSGKPSPSPDAALDGARGAEVQPDWQSAKEYA